MNLSKADYFNTITSLSLITIDDNYLLKLFSILASINHIIPSEYRNNNYSKPLFSQVILKDELPQGLLNIISLLDILPIIDNKFKDTEKIGGGGKATFYFEKYFKVFESETICFIYIFYYFKYNLLCGKIF